jgi:hypothetical protein
MTPEVLDDRSLRSSPDQEARVIDLREEGSSMTAERSTVGGRSPHGLTAWASRATVPVAVVFFALQAIGTIVATLNKLPYEVGGQGDPDTVARDFLIGGGTALSGPLPVLILLAFLIWLGRRHSGWGMVGLIGTVLLGVVAGVFGAQEPIAARMLQESRFGLLEATVVSVSWGGLVAIFATVAFSLLTIIGRLRGGS